MQELKSSLDAARTDAAAARQQVAQLKEQLQQGNQADVWVSVMLEGVTDDVPVEGHYWLSGSRDRLQAEVAPFGPPGHFRMILPAMDRQTMIERLEIEQPRKRRWAGQAFIPMQPELVLREEALHGGPQ